MKMNKKNVKRIFSQLGGCHQLLVHSGAVLLIGTFPANAQQDIIKNMSQQTQKAGAVVRQQLASQTIVNQKAEKDTTEKEDKNKKVQGVRVSPTVISRKKDRLSVDGNTPDKIVTVTSAAEARKNQRIVPDAVATGAVMSALATPRKQTALTKIPANNHSERDLSLITGNSQQRDPFALTSVILGSQNDKTAPSLQFTPVTTNTPIPQLRLKGIINTGGEKTALLEVAGYDTYVVKENDAIGIPNQGGSSVLKIKKIDRLSLIVEVGQLGQVIIVR